MNLQQLSESDLAITLEAMDIGGGCRLVFTDPAGNDFEGFGVVNDIGFGFDSLGNQIATRSVCAMWRMSSFTSAGRYVEPTNGWKLTWSNLLGETECGYITRFEPDRTMGIGRVYINLDLSDAGDD